jgi:hypothetical protein
MGFNSHTHPWRTFVFVFASVLIFGIFSIYTYFKHGFSLVAKFLQLNEIFSENEKNEKKNDDF